MFGLFGKSSVGAPKRQREAENERPLDRFIPYSCLVAPDAVKTREGDYLRTWKLAGVPFETVDSADLATWKDNLNTLFRSLPGGRVVLYSHLVRRSVFDRLEGEFENSFCRDLDARYYESLAQNQMRDNELYFTLLLRPAESGVERRLARSARTLAEIRNAEEKALRALGELSAQVEAGLALYRPSRLTEYKRAGVFFSSPLEFFNFLLSGSWQPVRLPRGPLPSYLGTSAVMVGAETIELRGVSYSRFVRLLDLKDYPPETAPGLLDPLLYAPFNFVLTQSFALQPKLKGKELLVRQQRQLSGSEDGSASQTAELSNAIDGVVSGDFSMGEYHFSLSVFGENLERLREDTNQAQAILQEQGFLPGLVTTALDAGFFAQLPGNLAYRPRVANLTTKNYASLTGYHNFSSGKREGNPWGEAVTLLKTPAGPPFYFNFHDATKGGNQFDEKLLGNTLVLGQSGSGKTVTLAFLYCQLMKFRAGARMTTFFFDKDHGAELVVRAAGGEYLALANGVPSGLNPFQLDPTPENLAFLERLVEVLVSQDGAPLSPADRQRITQAVGTVMAFPKEIRRLGLLPQTMTEGHGAEREGSVVKRLSRWVSPGPLGWVFDNPEDTLDFTRAQDYGIDGTAFLDNATVRSPISMYLLYRMSQVLDGRRFAFFMDEFWKWLGDSAFSGFVADMLKTIRKQNGFGVFATQSPSDVLNSPIARAIVEQCVTSIYLPNPRADESEYREGFKLTPAEFEILVELKPGSRLFLVKQGKTSTLAGLDLSGFDSELAILSGSTDNISILHDVLEENPGATPEQWLPLFWNRLSQKYTQPRRKK